MVTYYSRNLKICGEDLFALQYQEGEGKGVSPQREHENPKGKRFYLNIKTIIIKTLYKNRYDKTSSEEEVSLVDDNLRMLMLLLLDK